MAVHLPRQRHVERLGGVCIGCGYDLRGLSTAARCPECGLPPAERVTVDDPLSIMPIATVKRLRNSCWLASICVIGVLFVASARFWWPALFRYEPWVLAMLCGFWFVAVWRLTEVIALPAANTYGFGQRSRLRRVVRGLAPAWLVVGLIGVIMDFFPPGKGGGMLVLLDGARLALISVAVLQVLLLSILLKGLADWSRDELPGRLLLVTAWGVPITTALLVTVRPPMIVTSVLTLLWGVSLLAFPIALLGLARSIMWSVRHAREHRGRLIRRQKRQERFDTRVARSVAGIDGDRPPRDLARPPRRASPG